VTFERFTVVRVPFPFTDSNASKNRPVYRQHPKCASNFSRLTIGWFGVNWDACQTPTNKW
jgi:hypothetical protein